MRRIWLAVRHALPLLFVTAFIAWLLDYLGLSPFLAAFLTGLVAVFQYGLDKYRQLPPEPIVVQRVAKDEGLPTVGVSRDVSSRRHVSAGPALVESWAPRYRFPLGRLALILALIILLAATLYAYWVWTL